MRLPLAGLHSSVFLHPVPNRCALSSDSTSVAGLFHNINLSSRQSYMAQCLMICLVTKYGHSHTLKETAHISVSAMLQDFHACHIARSISTRSSSKVRRLLMSYGLCSTVHPRFPLRPISTLDPLYTCNDHESKENNLQQCINLYPAPECGPINLLQLLKNTSRSTYHGLWKTICPSSAHQ